MFYKVEAVNKARKTVDNLHLHNPSFLNHTIYLQGLSTQIDEISTVVHNLSPTGGKERQSGHFTLLVHLPRLLLNSGGELVDLVIDRTALSHQLTDLAVGMHNRGVVTPAECLADLWKRELS